MSVRNASLFIYFDIIDAQNWLLLSVNSPLKVGRNERKEQNLKKRGKVVVFPLLLPFVTTFVL